MTTHKSPIKPIKSPTRKPTQQEKKMKDILTTNKIKQYKETSSRGECLNQPYQSPTSEFTSDVKSSHTFDWKNIGVIQQLINQHDCLFI